MRTAEQDKADIGTYSFATYENLASLGALVKFALFQIDHATQEEFCEFQDEWRTLFLLIREKIEAARTSNSEVNYLASTFEPEGTHH